MTSFFAMGGYGAFVWPAFGMTALVMVWLLASTLRRLRTNERLLTQMQAATPRRRGATGGGTGGGTRRGGGGQAAHGTRPDSTSNKVATQ